MVRFLSRKFPIGHLRHKSTKLRLLSRETTPGVVRRVRRKREAKEKKKGRNEEHFLILCGGAFLGLVLLELYRSPCRIHFLISSGALEQKSFQRAATSALIETFWFENAPFVAKSCGSFWTHPFSAFRRIASGCR